MEEDVAVFWPVEALSGLPWRESLLFSFVSGAIHVSIGLFVNVQSWQYSRVQWIRQEDFPSS